MSTSHDRLIAQRLQQLRQHMKSAQLDYYYVPSNDPHFSEYVPEHWQRRRWISGFTGSAGVLVIGLERCYLWTDPRYTLQAEQQVDAALYQIMPAASAPETQAIDWLAAHAEGRQIGTDARLISLTQYNHWRHSISANRGNVVMMSQNLIDAIWKDQPVLPNTAIRLLALQYCGESRQDKIAAIQSNLECMDADHMVMSALDAIAWLFNIRGDDIAYTPVVIAYAVISRDRARLFVSPHRFTPSQTAALAADGIQCEPLETFTHQLTQLQGHVWLDPAETSVWTQEQLSQATPLIKTSPIHMMKARKNTTELGGMREAHRLDGMALCRFMHWLSHAWRGQTERSAAAYLTQCREQNELCQGLSFETISGYGDHGAIIHYAATPETDRPLGDDNLYLCDSGGQYLCGTTDVTRTLHLGTPTVEHRRYYTLVLKGHLALRHTPFPEGTPGERLDALARAPLWRHGLNYGHGTGHGVGHYLCVHEGPQSISGRATHIPLLPGMIVSNEPGVYFPGKYGIRIENLCVVEPIPAIPNTPATSDHRAYYQLQDLTLVPYARNLIDPKLLSQEEILWINDYHDRIRDLLLDTLESDVRAWLLTATEPLSI